MPKSIQLPIFAATAILHLLRAGNALDYPQHRVSVVMSDEAGEAWDSGDFDEETIKEITDALTHAVSS